MRKARLETVINGANIRPAITSPFSRRTTRDLPVSLCEYRVDRKSRHGFLAVARTIPSVHRIAEFLCIGETGGPRCCRSARAHGRKDHGSVTCAARSFLGRI